MMLWSALRAFLLAAPLSLLACGGTDDANDASSSTDNLVEDDFTAANRARAVAILTVKWDRTRGSKPEIPVPADVPQSVRDTVEEHTIDGASKEHAFISMLDVPKHGLIYTVNVQVAGQYGYVGFEEYYFDAKGERILYSLGRDVSCGLSVCTSYYFETSNGWKAMTWDIMPGFTPGF